MSEIEQYVAPSSLEQAAEYLRSGKVTILAGGTDLMPQSQGGRLKIKRTLMNIHHIAELKRITIDGGAMRIGALATITEIMESELVRKNFPILVEACDHFARKAQHIERNNVWVFVFLYRKMVSWIEHWRRVPP